MLTVRARSEIFVPKGVDNAQDGEAGSDDHEALVAHGGPLGRDVLVLTPFEHSLMDTIQANTVGIRFPRNLIELCG